MRRVTLAILVIESEAGAMLAESALGPGLRQVLDCGYAIAGRFVRRRLISAV